MGEARDIRMNALQIWLRRAVTVVAIVAAMAISNISHTHPEWLHRGSPAFSVLNWLYGLSLLFLLMGAPVWLLLGSPGQVPDAEERRALRGDVLFVLAGFLFVLFLILLFATQL